MKFLRNDASDKNTWRRAFNCVSIKQFYRQILSNNSFISGISIFPLNISLNALPFTNQARIWQADCGTWNRVWKRQHSDSRFLVLFTFPTSQLLHFLMLAFLRSRRKEYFTMYSSALSNTSNGETQTFLTAIEKYFSLDLNKFKFPRIV